LRRDFHSRDGRILSHITNFVHPDSCLTRERGLELFGQRCWLGVARRKGAHEARELRLGKPRSEVDAGDSRSREKLSKTALRGGSAQRDAVKQDLRARGTQEKTTLAALVESRTQFFPRSLKLRSRAHVAEFVQPRELQKNIQAAHELARSRSGIAWHGYERGFRVCTYKPLGKEDPLPSLPIYYTSAPRCE
jgi:hypothetical protein